MADFYKKERETSEFPDSCLTIEGKVKKALLLAPSLPSLNMAYTQLLNACISRTQLCEEGRKTPMDGTITTSQNYVGKRA